MQFIKTMFGRAEPEAVAESVAAPVAPVVPEPAPVASVVVPPAPQVNAEALRTVNLKRGMWVSDGNATGILTGCDSDGNAEVTLVKSDGSTLMVLNDKDQPVPSTFKAHVSQLTQAFIEHIPVSRRLEDELMQAMGYRNRGIV